MGQLSQSIYLQYDLKPLVSKDGLRKPLEVFGPHQFGDQHYLLEYKKKDKLQSKLT